MGVVDRRDMRALVSAIGTMNARATTVVRTRVSGELEKIFFPQPEWLLDAIHERVLPLPGHVPSSNQTDAELARRSRLGL